MKSVTKDAGGCYQSWPVLHWQLVHFINIFSLTFIFMYSEPQSWPLWLGFDYYRRSRHRRLTFRCEHQRKSELQSVNVCIKVSAGWAIVGSLILYTSTVVVRKYPCRWETDKQPISSPVTHMVSVPIFYQELVMFVMTKNSTLHIVALHSQNICHCIECMPCLWNNR